MAIDRKKILSAVLSYHIDLHNQTFIQKFSISFHLLQWLSHRQRQKKFGGGGGGGQLEP